MIYPSLAVMYTTPLRDFPLRLLPLNPSRVKVLLAYGEILL